MSVQNNEINEKRQTVRTPVEAKVQFSIVGTKGVYEGTSQDLSSKGVGFVTESELKPGMLLDFSMVACTDSTPPLRATVEVIRVEPQADNCSIRVGGGIKEIIS